MQPRAQGRLRTALLWAALCALFQPAQPRHGSGEALPGGVVRDAASPAELLDALADANTSVVRVQRDLHLSPPAVPFTVTVSRNVSVVSADGHPKTLDWGGSLRLLHLAAGSSLFFQNMVLQGPAPPSVGEAAALVAEMPGSPLWPTADGEGGHKITFVNCTIERLRTGCTPELLNNVARLLEQQPGLNGSVETHDNRLYVRGAMDMQTAIVHRLSKEQLGLATLHLVDSTVVCNEDPGELAAAAAAPTTPSTPGHSSALLWAAVGAGAGLLTAVVGGALLLWGARRQGRLQALLLDKEQASLSSDEPSTPGGGTPDLEAGMAGAGPAHAVFLPSVPSRGSVDVCMAAGRSDLAGRVTVDRRPSLSGRQSLDVGILGAAVWQTRVGPVEGLELGELLGRGSYGRAYRGHWKGALVAVKIIEQDVREGQACNLAREPLLSTALAHPNVVTCYRLCVTCVRPGSVRSSGDGSPVQHSPVPGSAFALDIPASSSAAEASSCDTPFGQSPSSPEGASGQQDTLAPLGSPLCSFASLPSGNIPELVPEELTPGLWETWMVLEYCDRGDLADAIACGKFNNPTTRALDLMPALLTLLDIAQGMDYLHSINVLHGDLKTRNALLKSARNDRRGFVIKLADFGLSRLLDQGQTHVKTASLGTPTNAAPELLMHGKLTKASDVYSFSILMWELLAGEEAYGGMTTFQVIAQVAQAGVRPTIPPDCPAPLADLMQRCWAEDQQIRPTFSHIVQELREVLKSTKQSLDLGMLPARA